LKGYICSPSIGLAVDDSACILDVCNVSTFGKHRPHILLDHVLGEVAKRFGCVGAESINVGSLDRNDLAGPEPFVHGLHERLLDKRIA